MIKQQQKSIYFLAVIVAAKKYNALFEQEIFNEMVHLSKTAGISYSNNQNYIIKYRDINPKYFITTGILEKLKNDLISIKADTLVLNIDVNPTQQQNIAEYCNCTVIIKSELIFEIFLQHSATKPSKIQIELANLQFIKSRLKGSYKSYDRIRGGIGIKGAGETKLEIDRRSIQTKINHLKKQMSNYHDHVLRIVKNRSNIPTFALVGYTNSGKTTLLNSLTNSHLKAENVLFSTVDVKTKRLFMSNSLFVIMTDTIGFIRDLPLNLVESFKTTLLEIQHADLLGIVIDFSSCFYREQLKTVEETLNSLQCFNIPKIYIYNKIDIISENFGKTQNKNEFYISALKHQGLTEIKSYLYSFFTQNVNKTPIINKEIQ